MARPRPGPTDVQVEGVIGNLLRAGVIVASLVVLAGGVIYLVKYGSTVPDHRVFHGEPAQLESMSGVLSQAELLSGRGLIQLGLLLLIATPIARVAFSVLAFVAQRDLLYVIVTLIVLGLLLFSLTARQ